MTEFDHDPIEAYCVRDKQMVEMENPIPVWTSKGTPGTRGECPDCGGTVFRMGATYLHEGMVKPTAVNITKSTKRTKPKLAANTIYVNYSAHDMIFAKRLAEDLTKVGFPTWLHDPSPETVNWASGVHPALKECDRMVFLLSAAALEDETVRASWEFFKAKHKPIVIAQINLNLEPPDDIRRSPRFVFADDENYKTAFRQMLQALAR